MVRICKAKRNCGFYYNRENALARAKNIAKEEGESVAVYEIAGAFHIYLVPETIEGFGELIAEF